MGPEADGSLGCQASGDVGIAETLMDLKPTEVGIEYNTILGQTPGNTIASEHLQPAANNMV